MTRTALAAAALGLALGGAWLLRGAPAPEPAATPASVVGRSIAYFERRLAVDPDNTMLGGQLVGRYILRFNQEADLADLTRAEALARRALPLVRDRSAAWSRLSGLLLMQHKFGPAFDAARRAAMADPGAAQARGAWLESALAIGAYPLADSLARTLDTGTVGGQVRRALWLDAAGHAGPARPLMGRACTELERSGGRPMVVAWCLTQLAGLDHTVQGPRAATATLRRALRLSPGYRGAVEGLANLALAAGDFEAAVAGFEAIRSDAHPDLYLRLAEGYRGLGRTEPASRAETRFLETAGRPEHEALYGNQLALYYAGLADRASLDAALAIATRETVRRPTVASWDLVAWVHYCRGELGPALEASDRSLAWGALSPTMAFHRSRILGATGRGTEAAALEREARSHRTQLAPHARRALDPAPGSRRRSGAG